jgi:hypothetical protein
MDRTCSMRDWDDKCIQSLNGRHHVGELRVDGRNQNLLRRTGCESEY